MTEEEERIVRERMQAIPDDVAFGPPVALRMIAEEMVRIRLILERDKLPIQPPDQR